MDELGTMLHDISLPFARSTNLRTLLPRLAEQMAKHLPVVEAEAVWLDRDGVEATISAYAPGPQRRWSARRSARFLTRKQLRGARWSHEPDPARVAIEPVALRLDVAVGHHGALSVAFDTDISVDRRSEPVLELLEGQCLRLGQLDATARRCRHATYYRNTSGPGELEPDTDISLEEPAATSTEIPVQTIDAALVACISAALRETRGVIYGEHGAAKLLGLKPSTLQSKMRKLGIERAPFVR